MSSQAHTSMVMGMMSESRTQQNRAKFTVFAQAEKL